MNTEDKIEKWITPTKEGFINVPDELDPLVNKIGMHLRIHTISQATSEPQAVCNMVYAAEQFFKNQLTSKDKELSELREGGFIIRNFNSDKNYWCRCDSCGWEDSSEFAEGGHQIADTGDYSDPVCPICHSSEINGDAVLSEHEDYSGIHEVKIPIDFITKPYKTYVKILEQALDNYKFGQQSLEISELQSENKRLKEALETLKTAIDYAAFECSAVYAITTQDIELINSALNPLPINNNIAIGGEAGKNIEPGCSPITNR